ncbi:MAG: hypothetical protein ACRD6W_17080, partial [Nitrososphaerales archaeon]
MPFYSLSPVLSGNFESGEGTNLTFGVNLTALTLNTSYTVRMFLNYTLKVSGEPYYANSTQVAFVYEKDTSGDGLTDWEKLRGWPVTEQWYPGYFTTFTATANPDVYSTNGLTSDYIEKEYGLNARTISTTNDGLLDMYNLTFDLGTGSPALPSTGFQYWYENTTYQFNQTCPDPEMPSPCSFSPPLTDASNLTATGSRNPGGDNSPWGAEVLWSGTGSGNALSKLESLVSSDDLAPLRAVTGSYIYEGQTHRTMTVWGKLSWGADPLAYSTSEFKAPNGDLIPDGAMVDPLGLTAVNVTLDSWSMSGLSKGDGVAVFIEGTSPAQTPYLPSEETDYSFYSVNGTSPGGGFSHFGDQGSFSVNFLVAPVDQSAT